MKEKRLIVKILRPPNKPQFMLQIVSNRKKMVSSCEKDIQLITIHMTDYK